MRANEISDILNSAPKIYKSILITGPWGIGKTHYVDEFIKETNNKAIYVSFFGKESSEQVKSEIGSQIMPKDAKIIKGVLEYATSFASDNKLLGLSVRFPALYKNDIEKYKNSYLKDKKLTIVFDDLERKSEKYSMIDLLGLIDEILRLENVSVVILANEDKVDEEEKKLLDEFKEKIVERTYYINKYSKDALNNIISLNIRSDFFEKYNEKIITFSKDFFATHEIKNLRTVIAATKFLNEILSTINIEDKEEIKFFDILGVCYSVVTENVEKIHIHTGENVKEDGFDFVKELNKDTVQRICHHYLNGSLFKTTIQHQFVKPINDIFNCFKKSENIKIINQLLSVERDKEEKPNFYKSKEQLINQIDDFYNNFVAKKSEIEFSTWLYNLDIQYIWIETLNSNSYKKKYIMERVEEYINNHVNLSLSLYNNKIDEFGGSYQSKYVKELINVINEKIEKLYYKDMLDEMVEDFENKIFVKIGYIKILTNFIKNVNLKKLANQELTNSEKYTEKKIYSTLKQKKWFFPLPIGELEAEQWGWCREIWNLLSIGDSKKVSDFVTVINKELDNNDGIFLNRIFQLQEKNVITGINIKKG